MKLEATCIFVTNRFLGNALACHTCRHKV